MSQKSFFDKLCQSSPKKPPQTVVTESHLLILLTLLRKYEIVLSKPLCVHLMENGPVSNIYKIALYFFCLQIMTTGMCVVTFH